MLAMTLLICGAVLCVAIAALFIFQVLNFRSNFQRDTTTLAVIIANNSTAAMAFKDDQAASEVVGALKAKPTVVAASLVLPNGSLFAQFGKAEDGQTWSNFPAAGEFRFTGGQLLVSQPVGPYPADPDCHAGGHRLGPRVRVHLVDEIFNGGVPGVMSGLDVALEKVQCQHAALGLPGDGLLGCWVARLPSSPEPLQPSNQAPWEPLHKPLIRHPQRQ